MDPSWIANRIFFYYLTLRVNLVSFLLTSPARLVASQLVRLAMYTSYHYRLCCRHLWPLPGLFSFRVDLDRPM